MSDDAPPSRAPYWVRAVADDGNWRQGRVPSRDLANLRRGAGREPGTVPEMWRHHSTVLGEHDLRPYRDAWSPPPALVAEHHALVLFGYHQQSESQPVHKPGIGLGHALRRLHTSQRFTADAIDRRFHAAVTATEITELARHLRGLIQLLRSLSGITPMDYSALLDDLGKWQHPDRRKRVQRRWGLQFHTPVTPEEGNEPASSLRTP